MTNQALRVATPFEQHCQIVVSIRVSRVEFEAAHIASLSVFKAVQLLERNCAIEVQHRIVRDPDGQFKLLHLWAAKFPQAGRADYASDSSVTASLEAASRRR